MRQPYLIYKRTVRGKKSLYVKVWDEKKYDYSIRKSILSIKDELGAKVARFPHTSKAGADKLVQIWLKERPKEISQERFDQYLSGFWEEDSAYIRGKALRGKSYSRTYLSMNKSGIDNHFIPFLDAVRKRGLLLHQVNPGLLESFLNYMTDKGKLSSRRINSILQSVTVPLGEAYRLGLITDNPGSKVTKLQEQKGEKGIFTPKEVKAFFEKCDDPVHYGINLLAATTGMRLGECRGLLKEDVHEGYIEVCHNWQDGEGLKEPKWGSRRLVPIPTKTQEILDSLIKQNKFQNEFIFWGKSHNKPIGKRTVSQHFNDLVENKMEIKDRDSRGLSFHGWRHFYNSMLRGNVADHALRKLTGHANKEMTENYSHITEDQKKAVRELAEKIL